MILVIDNYDSFTYNLVHLMGEFTSDIMVRRNDAITVDEIKKLSPQGILLSPGPGRPESAGITMQTVEAFSSTIPILGVCLGHQAIGAAFGGSVVHAPVLMHGRTSKIQHQQKGIFKGVKNPFVATRYHSLVVSSEGWPKVLEVTATTEDGVVMGMQHATHSIYGVQFHPESILTEEGRTMMSNWIEVTRR
jgi:anthranilate synthase component 2